MKNSWVTRVAYHETAVKVQRPEDKAGECSALSSPWPTSRAGLPAVAKRVEEAGALTRQEEEGTPGDGHAALGDGVAVSNSGTLHAHNAEDHGHKAQKHGHHHQGSG